jgi:transferase hexapeptide repeat containing protein
MKLISKVFNKLFYEIEKRLYINWFNPFATLYFNFRTLPFKKAIVFPIWFYGRPNFMCLSGEIDIDSEKISSGMIRINYNDIGSPCYMRSQTEISVLGKIIFHGSAKIRTGNRIVVGWGAKLKIGNKVLICDEVLLGCHNHIAIGDNTWITHRCQVFDTNYHYLLNLSNGEVPNVFKQVKIGCNCWICNQSTIHSAVIPDDTIVTSNTLVNKNFSEYKDGIILGGIPAKVIKCGKYRLVTNLERERELTTYYRKNPDELFFLDKALYNTCSE